ncbi:hypothetical protein EEB18_020535 [Sphingopyxis sp. OPL5]|uniref:hypothetical protein n=1 Tax=Sphingopyxis sp. OPL5 TaxID=2486273 RepID=UPI00164D4D5D|nr:hypothetical protein [Sphingopyxis sp. OPL5]QNO27072.1 hypothetical protein EEB18_020535 [Sphingopyxis sp. OPL5]
MIAKFVLPALVPIFAAPTAALAADKAFPIQLADEATPDLAEAFVEAFETPMAASSDLEAVRVIDERSYHFRPVAMHKIGDHLWALLSTGSLEDAGHSDGGINAVHYLRDAEGGWQRAGEWLNLGAVGTVGNAATGWAFSDAIGKYPYLVTSGGGVWQGCAISTATLTELAPGGPVDRAGFTDAMSSGAGTGQADGEYDGRIVAAEPDKSFTVGYTGTRSFTQRYVLKDGKYALVGIDQVPGC